MSTQYSFAPYQDPPEDIPAYEREQAAYPSTTHYSSSDDVTATGGESSMPFLSNTATNTITNSDDRINQFETSLPLRLYPFIRR